MQQVIRQLIQHAVTAAFPDVTLPAFQISYPEIEQHGDYATNVALILAKIVGSNPIEVADRIVKSLPAHEAIEKAEAVKPGFINFFIRDAFFAKNVEAISKAGDAYGRITDAESKVMFEFGCPNTHKIPHIGHLFSYCYGESAVRLLEFTGHDVFRENYQGDVGLHVAKCLWVYQQDKREPAGLAEKVAYLSECYQRGSLAYDEDPAAKQAIDELNELIYKQDPTVHEDWQKTRQWSLDYYSQFEARIGSHFDRHYFESETSEDGLRVVKEHMGDIFQEDAGAVIFKGEEHGLHTRVFINKFGNPTYEAKDVGLITKKLAEDFKPSRYIYTTANEQNDYMRVVFKTFELIYPELSGKLKHIGFGMLNLTTGKMSSRAGNIVTAFSLVEMVKERVRAFIKENRNYSEAETESIAELVAIGAIKHSFLKSAATKNITFDLESSISFDGNSGPYLQYTYARCRSVLGKSTGTAGTVTDLNSEERAVAKWLARFGDTIKDAADGYAPHILAGYLFELAQRYSYFYNQHQINSDDPSVSAKRLQLTAAVAQVLKNGLSLLGIEVVEKI